jgi:hypothetical protein
VTGRAAERRPGAVLRSRSLAAIALAIVSTAVLACGSSGPTARVLPDPIASPSAVAGSGPSASTSGAPAAAATPASPAAASGGTDVLVDPSLLSFIPVTGHGLVQAVDPDTTAQVAQDPDLRANASALIMAIYTAAPASASAAPTDDIAVASVIRLRDPSTGDDWFRAWRDSYDKAACDPAGGVARNSQTDVGTHTVFVAACAGGAFTYHTRLADGAIVISVTSVGSLRLGETIMERLAP